MPYISSFSDVKLCHNLLDCKCAFFMCNFNLLVDIMHYSSSEAWLFHWIFNHKQLGCLFVLEVNQVTLHPMGWNWENLNDISGFEGLGSPACLCLRLLHTKKTATYSKMAFISLSVNHFILDCHHIHFLY